MSEGQWQEERCKIRRKENRKTQDATIKILTTTSLSNEQKYLVAEPVWMEVSDTKPACAHLSIAVWIGLGTTPQELDLTQAGQLSWAHLAQELIADQLDCLARKSEFEGWKEDRN